MIIMSFDNNEFNNGNNDNNEDHNADKNDFEMNDDDEKGLWQ